ncbi:glycerophosphodiester phosphodiesterase family protein [Flavobacterium antarcticum]|uniref:glycerophosphodiester phosphodiesterase family protein n=1 Tax=Flavobacterium antarcticum TaxID=271155 RepID=UPI0003B5D358|nr:glycerophosphodiester phosphodiesterase family protein [Flavobacterium antarcticum]
MKFVIKICCFLLITQFLSCGVTTHKSYYISFPKAKEFHEFTRFSAESYPLVSAHRGGPIKGFPENSTATFANTITYIPAIIETDIALSQDSVLVMMHDNTLDRTTTGTGKIGDYTYKELQKLFLKDTEGNVTPYKIETLDEVLQWGNDKVIYTLDVKRGVPMKMIVDAVRRNKAERNSIIITYNANQAAEVARLAPDFLISVSARGKEDVERMEKLGVKVDKMVAFVGTSEPKKETYLYLQSRNIPSILGTMGNIDKSAAANGDVLYYKLIENGANILSSDRHVEAGKELEKYVKDKGIESKYIKHLK